MARLTPGGTPDPAFGVAGRLTTDIQDNDAAEQVEILPDNRIVVGGGASTAGDNDTAILRYEVDGDLDPTFGGTGIVLRDSGGPSDAASTLALQPDGKILAQAGPAFDLIRFNPDGSLDLDFGTNGVAPISPGGDTGGQTLALQSDGSIIEGGFTNLGPNPDNFALARIGGGEPDPGPDPPPRPTCQGKPVNIVAVAGAVTTGTPNDDVIVGTTGRDRINARGGNDIICALSGRSRIKAGPGADVVIGGNRRDVVRGGGGRDVIRGKRANDRLFGNGGPDLLVGGKGRADRCVGGAGPTATVPVDLARVAQQVVRAGDQRHAALRSSHVARSGDGRSRISGLLHPADPRVTGHCASSPVGKALAPGRPAAASRSAGISVATTPASTGASASTTPADVLVGKHRQRRDHGTTAGDGGQSLGQGGGAGRDCGRRRGRSPGPRRSPPCGRVAPAPPATSTTRSTSSEPSSASAAASATAKLRRR